MPSPKINPYNEWLEKGYYEGHISVYDMLAMATETCCKATSTHFPRQQIMLRALTFAQEQFGEG